MTTTPPPGPPHPPPPAEGKDPFTAMLTRLLRTARARLFPPPLETATYSCGRCGLRVRVTDHPDRVTKILSAVISHPCKPKPKAL